MSTPGSVLRAIGSLWFAAVLLVVWLVAMACATVYESANGAERALAEFYHAWWFEVILALLAVNLTAAVLARLPLTRKQIGFVLTHAGIVVTLAGAWVTQELGVNGQLPLVEKETAERFRIPRTNALTLVNRENKKERHLVLDKDTFSGDEVVDSRDDPPSATLGSLRVSVLRYVPNGRFVKQILDDNPRPQTAVEVTLQAGDAASKPSWLLPGESAQIGMLRTTLRPVSTPAELDSLLNPPPDEATEAQGAVVVTHQGQEYHVPFSVQPSAPPIPLGETGYTARVLRYLPHATVGADNKVTSLSDRPENPAVEVEITGPAGSEKRLAFAKFPDFQTMHGKSGAEGLKVTFTAPQDTAARTPIELLASPDGKLYARFNRRGQELVTAELVPGTPVDTPWPGRQLVVTRRFNNARVNWVIEAVDPTAQTRRPAVLLEMASLGESKDVSQMWVQKHSARPVKVDNTQFQIRYEEESVPLGFAVTLNRFHIGEYPGTSRPRSFESSVTIVNPVTGTAENRVISMNNPLKQAGYSLFQSSYDLRGGQRLSVLSVARDPGLPVVFAGYILTTVGMVVVLITRAVERRRIAAAARSVADRVG